jgi:hypothetical protein
MPWCKRWHGSKESSYLDRRREMTSLSEWWRHGEGRAHSPISGRPYAIVDGGGRE